MNKIGLRNLLFISLFFLLISSPLLAQPTKESLLKAWEALQKNDPETVLFEKLEKDRYNFKTNWFPFDGELQVINVSIQEQASDYGEHVWGVVEVALKDIPMDFFEKHGHSYLMWKEGSVLHFQEEAKRWVTTAEYYAGKRKKTGHLLEVILGYVYSYSYILLTILIIGMIFSWRKVHKMTKKNIQRSLALSEETNRLLKEILDALKKS